MQSSNERIHHFPPEFDADYYVNRHSDTSDLDIEAAWKHYQTIGKQEGRWPSHYAGRHTFIELIPTDGLVLEIGPGANPVVKGPNVRYFDALTTDELKARAIRFGESLTDTPELHYTSPNGDLSVVQDRFKAIVSSHAIEHQPDLVRHLQQVEALLEPGGSYFVMAPDKRFTEDFYVPESTLGDIVQAYVERRQRHILRNIIDVSLVKSHNDGERHWDGDHGPKPERYSPNQILQAISAYVGNNSYIDVHAWFWTTDTFKILTNAIADLGWTSLRPIRVYQPPRPANEFCAIFAIP